MRTLYEFLSFPFTQHAVSFDYYYFFQINAQLLYEDEINSSPGKNPGFSFIN
jgi:hypothetical protein